MEKKEADRIIGEYIKPLYGFSMNKTKNITEAEELTSRIILQVYDVLIKKDSFVNLNSYVFKIAHNVWTKYLDDKTKIINNLPIDNINISSNESIDNDIIENEILGKLRVEISFLSNQQREIVILYYYKGLKVKEIAERLEISEGTIKWHLYESKKEMKKGMEIMRTVGNLGISPIKFINMGHDGEPGKRGDTSDFFRKSITQNIAYAAYHEPLTINKIAEELGISPVFVEDEINELEEYGFVDKLIGRRYQTNMLILEYSDAKWEEMYKLSKKYADIIVEEYLLQFFHMEKQFKELDIYYPNNDFNLFLWSVIPYAMKKLSFEELMQISYDEVTILRKDGGNYIASAQIQKELKKCDEFNYGYCGDMYRGNEELKILSWQLNTTWSNRDIGWRDNLTSDYIGLYHFINEDLIENAVNIDIYRRLLDKGYLIKTKDGYKINIVYFNSAESKDRFEKMLPNPSETLKRVAKEFGRKIYEIEKVGQPIHMHKTLKYYSQNKLTNLKTYMLKNLIDRGLLKEPSEEESKGISTILFIER